MVSAAEVFTFGLLGGGGPDPRYSVGRQMLQPAYNPPILAQFALNQKNLKTDAFSTIMNLVSKDGKPNLALYKDTTKNVLTKPDQDALAFVWAQFSSGNEVFAQLMEEGLVRYRDAYLKFYTPVLDNFKLDTPDGLAAAIVVSAMSQVAFPEKALQKAGVTPPPVLSSALASAIRGVSKTVSGELKQGVSGDVQQMSKTVSCAVPQKPLMMMWPLESGVGIFSKGWANTLADKRIVSSPLLDPGLLAIYALFSIKDSDYKAPNPKFTPIDKETIARLIFVANKGYMKGDQNGLTSKDAVSYGKIADKQMSTIGSFMNKLGNLKDDSVAKPMLIRLFRAVPPVSVSVAAQSTATPIMIKRP